MTLADTTADGPASPALDVPALVDAVWAGFAHTRSATAADRAERLEALADAIRTDAESLAASIHADTGKPEPWARIEAQRAAAIARIGAHEAIGLHPDAQRLDAQPTGAGRLALTLRIPRGPVLALAPFNFPLHLAIHKIAPALAAGASTLLVSSPRTPRTVAAIRGVIERAGLPAGAVVVADAGIDRVDVWELITHPRLPVVSFTGSDTVGRRIVDAVPRKQVIVELGSNAAAIVAPEYLSAGDIAHAADRIATFAFYNAGQACTSPQRIYVPRAHLESFVAVLVEAARRQDLRDDVGPVIDEHAARRIRSWIDEATAAGARVATGGSGSGSGRVIEPTVLVDTPAHVRAITEELFGPVVSVVPYDDVDGALAAVNNTRFGLSAGIFTRDIDLAFRAARDLEVGQVVIGDIPTFRSDLTPFGGVKDSGRGREGVRAAIEDYTVTRTVVLPVGPL